MHHFGSSLKVGKAGEAKFQLLAAKNGIVLEQTDGRAGDFIDEHGQLWEVKSDSYDMNKTSNFFIERYSNIDKGTNGGVWQAAEHHCEFFAYFFPQNGTAFVFKTKDLLKQLESSALGSPIEIRNVRHTTVGFKVNRNSLTPVMVLK